MQSSPLSSIETWGSPTLEGLDTSNMKVGVPLNGVPGRQFVQFYKKKTSEIRATKVKLNEKTGDVRVLETAPFDVEREYVKIVTPGDKNIIDTKAEDYHKREHFRHYASFRDGKMAPVGQSIDDCSFVSASVATELRYRGCHTVEQLADASDVLCSMTPSGYELREFARAHVKANAPDKVSSEVKLLREELAAVKSLLNAQGQPIKSEEVVAPKRRGRPARTAEVTE
jgi:hypothetical protein